MRTALAPLLAGLLMLAPALAPAQDAPLPQGVAAVTLRDGWTTADGRRMAALQLDLQPGWKTYWRAPGEAGIPARFDWTGSQNLRAVTPLWPRPIAFELNGMRTLGYANRLILPLDMRTEDPTRPVRVKASVEMGVCDNICVPVTLRLDAVLGPGGSPDPQIQAALDLAPRPAREAGLRRHSCAVAPIADGLRLTARIEMPPLGPEEVAAIELQGNPVWVSQPEVQRADGVLTATADLVPANGQPFAIDRSALRLTVIAGSDAVELLGCPSG